jgi:hypothetical protein
MRNDRAANAHELFAVWALAVLLAAAMLAGYWTTGEERTIRNSARQMQPPGSAETPRRGE